MSGRTIGCGNPHPAPEWVDCCWPGCYAVAEGGGPPLCQRHYAKVGEAYMREQVGRMREVAKSLRPSPSVDEHLKARQEALLAQSVVYYIKIGDHVKIGYTVNMRQRLIALRVDDEAVLATEPGGRELESARHRQFATERIGRRENFNPSRRLLAHIAEVRAEHGPPRITTYPRVSVDNS